MAQMSEILEEELIYGARRRERVWKVLAGIGLTFGVGALMLYMVFIILQLAKESKAGRFGTFVLLLVLGFGLLGFVAKGLIKLFIAGTGDCMGVRWRAGSAHTAAGAPEWIEELVKRLRSAGVERITLRLDKGFFSKKMVETLQRLRVDFVMKVPSQKWVRRLAGPLDVVELGQQRRVDPGRVLVRREALVAPRLDRVVERDPEVGHRLLGVVEQPQQARDQAHGRLDVASVRGATRGALGEVRAEQLVGAVHQVQPHRVLLPVHDLAR